MARIRISPIIVHSFSAFVVLLILTVIFLAQLFNLPVKAFSKIETWRSVLTYHYSPDINCAATPTLPQSADIYPECLPGKCIIHTDHGSFPAIAETPSDAVGNLSGFFADEDRQLVSYVTNGNRIILNASGKLVQSIDESPGINHQLTFEGYLQESGTLVYLDEKTKDRYYYSATSIELYRNYCPMI